MSRGSGWAALVVLTLARPVGAAPPLLPGDATGEGRSLLRDVDRTRTNVAGEADAGAVVANPANMGFLKAIGGVIEGSWTRATAQRRGSGVGGFVALPLSLKLFGRSVADNFLALGIGYQHLRPTSVWFPQGQVAAHELGGRTAADLPYHKVSLSVAVPLMRWAPGLALGLSYSRLWSARNLAADDLNQVDLAIGYRPHRVVAVGLVARAINMPRAHGDATIVPSLPAVIQPFELDPELALRPIRGARALELAVGARIVPVQPLLDPRFALPVISPRVRVEAGGRGVRVFAEGERYGGAAMVGSGVGLRFMTGVEFDLANVGLAVAPSFGSGGGGAAGLQGVAGKLRVSAERYASLADQTGEALRVDVGGYAGDRGMFRLVELIDRLGEQRGALLLLEVEALRLGYAQIEELREALLRLRARGGRVAVYLRGGGIKEYFLASAAERIFSHPNSRLSIVGLRVEVFFFADLLAKLGARAEFVRVAEYKSRPEQFELRSSSEPSAAQRQLLLTDTWNHLVRLIARGRGKTEKQVADWVDAAPHAPEGALGSGLVDELAYVDELEARLGSWLGRRVKLKPPGKRPAHAEAYGPGPQVAVLHIEGTMSDGVSLEIPIVGSKLAGSETLVKQIDALREDRRVKAVVVRIDSPGGSVAAADAMTRALERTAKVKPVVISMGNVAASGGYYVATAGQYIFSDALTRTGSIGIFRPKVDLSGTLKLFGVGIDELSVGAKAGLYSWWKPYTPEEREAAQRGIEAQYQIFVQRVARARAMAPAEVDRVARGRIWSGVRAQEIGLVDAYGGLREAVLHARALAKLGPTDGELRHYPRPPNLVEQIDALFGLRLPSPLGLRGGSVAGAELVDGALLWVLRRLPASVWWMSGPEPLAMAEEVVTLE